MKKLTENNKILNTVLLITFICLSLFVGKNHEPWADEAQAWLIARDSSICDIIFNIAKYEGTPVLWHLIIKLLITCKLSYKYYYLVPVFFSSIGVYVILFKLKINNIYKILLPFTYFIGYEYTIKARSYSLLLPILSLIAMLYEKRKEHVYLYNFFLLILSSVSLHGAIISGMLCIFEVFEIINNLIREKNFILIKKEIISVIVLVQFYIFIIITVFPPPDIYVYIEVYSINLLGIIKTFIYWIIEILEAFCLKYENYYKFGISSLILVIVLFICILKSNRNKNLFLNLFIFPVLFILLVRISSHHIGIIFYAFIFASYLVKKNMNKYCQKIFFVLFTIVLCVQVFWYSESCFSEVKMDFCAGKKVSEYLKTNDYKNKKIYASGYYVVSILPYFDDNIFCDERGKQTYYTWSTNNLDWIRASSKENKYENNLEDDYDIVILDDQSYGNSNRGYNQIINEYKKRDDYKEMHFKARTIFKGNSIENEKQGFFLF